MPTDCHCPGAYEGLHSSECGYYRKPVTVTAGAVITSAGRVMSAEGRPEWHAEQLFSSLEAWRRTPENHRAETPKRFVQALKQLTEREEFKFTCFPNEDPRIDEMVTVGPIPFYTLCAHHIVPFFGNAWVSYIPQDSVAGLSKFARAVKWQAKGFWVQETLTQAIANYLDEVLNPLGVGVVLKAEHMCMAMRGVEVAGAITTTSAMKGVYADHTRTAKAEFMEAIKNV